MSSAVAEAKTLEMFKQHQQAERATNAKLIAYFISKYGDQDIAWEQLRDIKIEALQVSNEGTTLKLRYDPS